MAVAGGDDLFERLKNDSSPDAIRSRQDAARERADAQLERSQKRYVDLIRSNSTQPAYFESIRVLGATRTRDGFLKKIVEPALERSKKGELTLKGAIEEMRETAARLSSFDIFHPNIQIHFDTPQSGAPSSPFELLPLSAIISLKERGRLRIHTGTNLGSTDASVYGKLQYTNIFGGGEAFNVHAAQGAETLGTRTQFAYDASLTAPIDASPFANWELKAFNNSRDNREHASHIERNKGVSAVARWFMPGVGVKHELGYERVWRQITDLHPNASQHVRLSAGDSVKSAITYTVQRDTRDSIMMPSTGTLLRSRNTLAGVGPFGGTIAHFKSELETAGAFPVPLPFVRDSPVTFSSSFRGGFLYPLAPSGASSPKPSNVADRFSLGGANDVRGFHLGGIGPHAGRDSLGGDAFVAGSASILFPFPRTGPDSNLRFHLFVNGGRLSSLQHPPDKHKATILEGMQHTLKQLVTQAPSLAAGFGVVYAHPAARFEVNFCLPFVVRGWSTHEGAERARKGFQFGIGMEFL